ncbi:MAG: CHAT domain-containing protein [Cyanobacteria bacterium P01_F01_bin.150]
MNWHVFPLRFLRCLSWGVLGIAIAVAISTFPSVLPTVAITPNQESVMEERPFVPTDATTISQSVSDDNLAMGRRAYNAGEFVVAIERWQAAYREATQASDTARQVMSLNGLSSAYQALNNWEQAQETNAHSRTLLEQSSQFEPILWGQTLNTYAGLLLNQAGQAEIALSTWQQAATYYEQAGDKIGQLGCEINQAEALQHLGFYRRARQQLETVNQQLETIPDSEIKVAGLRSLGKALQLIGHPQDSYNAMAEGLAVAQRINANAEISSLQLSIGKLSAAIGASPETALAYFQAAEESALTPLDQLQARLDQLALYIDSDQFLSVPDLVLTLHHQLQTLSPSRTTIYGAVNLAYNLTRLPPSHEPLSKTDINQLLANAVKAAEALHDARAQSYALQQMGQLYSQNQQWSDAIALTQKSLNLAESIRSPDVVSQSAWQLGKLYKQVNQPQQAIDAYTEAVDSLKALRGDLVAINQDVQFSYREQVEPVYRELVGLLLEEKSQASLEQARTVLEALQVAELDNFFQEACLDIQTNQIDQIDPNATVIYAIVLSDRLAIIYSKAGQPLQVYETPINQSELDQSLRSLLANLHLSSDRNDRLRLSEQLYDWIIRPAEEAQMLTPDQSLVFVLDGLLRNIPMAALYDGEHYLIEKYAIALSPGLQLMQAQPLNQKKDQALVGGISQARGRFSALPSVETEVEAISKWLPSFQLLNAQFTRDVITHNLTNSPINVIHLATHGQFSSNFDDTFFLTWDDTININELSEMLQNREANQQSAIELLTLSACETAAGDDRAVLGLAGLAVRSGARSTIATLWPIKDEVAQQLMTTFYRNLKSSSDAHMSKAEALRQAQLELIHSDDFSDPFFWSAYVLIGNWL